VIECYDDCSMSLATTRAVVAVRTTCLNIKGLSILTTEARVRSQAGTWGNFVGIGTGFSPSTSVVTC
jgi:hypothetical protein